MTHHPPRIFEALAEVEGDRAFKPRMEAAVAAADILFGAVVFPVGRFVHLPEGLVVAVRDEVTGTFPSARITRDGRPRAAQKITLADQVI